MTFGPIVGVVGCADHVSSDSIRNECNLTLAHISAGFWSPEIQGAIHGAALVVVIFLPSSLVLPFCSRPSVSKVVGLPWLLDWSPTPQRTCFHPRILKIPVVNTSWQGRSTGVMMTVYDCYYQRKHTTLIASSFRLCLFPLVLFNLSHKVCVASGVHEKVTTNRAKELT